MLCPAGITYATVRQPTARGPDPARDIIMSGPPSHLSKIEIYQW